MSTRPLRIHEELMLLALRDREGTVFGGTMYTYGLGGAMLAELVLEGRLRLDEKNRVHVADPSPTGHPRLDAWLEEIRGSKKPRDASDWVSRIANSGGLKHEVAIDLVRQGILRSDEASVLWIFSRTIYPEVDPGPERELMARIESAIFGEEEVDARTAIAVTLADQTSILGHLFDRKRLKARGDRIEAIAEGDLISDATAQAVEAVQAAIFMTTIIPAIVTTTIITN